MNKADIALKIIIIVIITVIAWAIPTLLWIPLDLHTYITAEQYSLITYAITFTVPFLFMITPFVIKKLSNRKPKQTLQKTAPTTTQPQIETIVETPAPVQEEPKQEKRPEGIVDCSCGVTFPNIITFRNHQIVTGHLGTLRGEPIPEEEDEVQPEATEPATQQQQPSTDPPQPKKQETVEEIVNAIKIAEKKTELEKQNAEYERSRIIVAGLNKIRQKVESGKATVTASDDLLTKEGPKKIYITLDNKEKLQTEQSQETEQIVFQQR